MDERLYFGRPGALQVLPEPRGGRDITRLRRRSSFALGSGGVRTATIVGGKRTFSLNWAAVDAATWAYLESFDQGHAGPGPFVYLDPSRRNMLTDNQSAATSVTNSASNFTVSGTGGTIASDAVTLVRSPLLHPRSLKWSFAVTGAANSSVSLDAPGRDFPGIPVAIRPHSFGIWAMGGGASATTRLQLKFDWLKADGTTSGPSDFGPSLALTTGWSQVLITNKTPPAGTAYCNATISASGATITAGSTVNIVEPQMVEGTFVDAAWTPGTGVLPVDVVSLNENPPFGYSQYREGPTLVLQEVGG